MKTRTRTKRHVTNTGFRMISVDDASGVLWLFSSMQLQGVEDAKLDKARDFLKLNCY